MWGFLIWIRLVNRTKGVKLRFEYDHIAPSGFGVAPIKRVPTTMFSLVRIWPMFEQEAPKWPWEVFNDPDSNTIQVGPKKELSYDSDTIKKPPNEFGLEPIKRVTIAMFSLVRIWPMFEQEAPEWPWELQLDSNTIISRTEKRLDLIQIWSAP